MKLAWKIQFQIVLLAKISMNTSWLPKRNRSYSQRVPQSDVLSLTKFAPHEVGQHDMGHQGPPRGMSALGGSAPAQAPFSMRLSLYESSRVHESTSLRVHKFHFPRGSLFMILHESPRGSLLTSLASPTTPTRHAPTTLAPRGPLSKGLLAPRLNTRLAHFEALYEAASLRGSL